MLEPGRETVHRGGAPGDPLEPAQLDEHRGMHVAGRRLGQRSGEQVRRGVGRAPLGRRRGRSAQSRDDVGVGQSGRAEEMGGCALVVEQPGRGGVQRPATTRRQVRVDRGPQQRVGEPQREPVVEQQATLQLDHTLHRLLDGQLGERRDRRQLRRGAEYRDGMGEACRTARQPGEPVPASPSTITTQPRPRPASSSACSIAASSVARSSSTARTLAVEANRWGDVAPRARSGFRCSRHCPTSPFVPPELTDERRCGTLLLISSVAFYGRVGMDERRHAVVIGGGMGGLLAARVLADHVEEVTVVDRDRFPEAPEHRAGVPQSQHVHALLPRGAELIATLFPGITEDLLADGAAVPDGSAGLRIVSPAGLLPLSELPEGGLLFSRTLLEWRIRTRLAAREGVMFAQDTEVVGLDAEPGGGRVRGVHVRDRRTGARTSIAADLVVDAGGRGSKAGRWLAELGYGEVSDETVTSGLGYASRFYARPPDFPREWSMVLVNGRAPGTPRAGLVTEIENDVWHVTLGGLAGETPPTDEEGFLAYAATVADPSLHEAVRVARPLTPIRGWRTPTNRLRHFERLRRWPAGLVVTADAVCAFNPIYGQGMTVAAMDAFVLADALERSGGGRRAGFERDFQRRLAASVAVPWMIASTEDLRWDGVTMEGARPPRGTALVRRYLDAVLRVAVHDTPLADRYFAVIGMNAHPRTLFAPRVLARVARLTLAGVARRPADRGALSPEGLAAARALPAHDVATVAP